MENIYPKFLYKKNPNKTKTKHNLTLHNKQWEVSTFKSIKSFTHLSQSACIFFKTVFCCRYPFVLSKSSMYSVGAPHTWPMALGALMWLIDNVKVRRNVFEQTDSLHWSVRKPHCAYCLLQTLQTLSDQKMLFLESWGDRHDIDEDLEYHKVFIINTMNINNYFYSSEYVV